MRDISTGQLLREVAHLYVRAQREQVACCDGPSLVQCHVLSQLHREQGITQRQLVQRLGFDKSWVSRAVDALVEAGLIAKQAHSADRRSVWLSLTAAGQLRASQLDTQLNQHADVLLSSMPQLLREQIHASLAWLHAALQGDDQIMLSGAEQAPALAFNIRSASDKDWPEIQHLLIESGLPLAGAQQHIDAFRVAVDEDGVVVAVAGLEHYGKDALLRSVATAHHAQKLGMARALLAVLIDDTRRHGVRALYLLTNDADAYFARHGFRRIDRTRVPASVQQSVEFQGVCPASAIAMALPLDESR